MPGEEGPVIPVPRFRHPAVISFRYTEVIQDERGIAFFILTEAHVHSRKVSGRKFLVGPRKHDALVLDDVKEIARMVLVAKRKRASFVGLDQGILARKVHVGVLVQ